MSYEWDHNKNESNILKHGIDFQTAQLIFDGPIVEFQDIRKDYGEIRFAAFGEVNATVFFVVYTWRSENRRLISARLANSKERSLYYAKIKN